MTTQIWWLRPTQGEAKAHFRCSRGQVLSTRQPITMTGQDDPFPSSQFRCFSPTPRPLLLGALRFPTPTGSCPCIVSSLTALLSWPPAVPPGLGGPPPFHPPEKPFGQKPISSFHFWSQTARIRTQDLPHTSCASCFVISRRLSPFATFA